MFYKLFIISVLFLFSMSVFSGPTEEDKAYMKKVLNERGLPDPDTLGIKVVPRSTLNLPREILDKGNFEHRQLASLGYVLEQEPIASSLINFKESMKEDFDNIREPLPAQSTHLRHNLDDLKLAFEFREPAAYLINVLAVSPYVSYTQDGWSGITLYFEKEDIGMCAFSEIGVKAAHTGVEIAMEDVKYLINDKPTLIDIRGNSNSGFLFKVRWFTPEIFYELECANMKFSKALKDKIIDLAKDLDPA